MAVILAGTVRLIAPDPGAGLRAGLDLLGAVLATAGLMAAVLAIVGAGEHGWTSVCPPRPGRPARGGGDVFPVGE